VHRYGFHGISVQWAASQVRAERLVVCHLGGGRSVTAVREGRSVDTTMGFSPLAVGVFVHRVSAAVAAMAAACGGVDVLVFTGGIGEHADDVRERIVDRVRFLGEFRVEVVESREELVIAMETRRLLAPG
jgi:acetate kinase